MRIMSKMAAQSLFPSASSSIFDLSCLLFLLVTIIPNIFVVVAVTSRRSSFLQNSIVQMSQFNCKIFIAFKLNLFVNIGPLDNRFG